MRTASTLRLALLSSLFSAIALVIAPSANARSDSPETEPTRNTAPGTIAPEQNPADPIPTNPDAAEVNAPALPRQLTPAANLPAASTQTASPFQPAPVAQPTPVAQTESPLTPTMSPAVSPATVQIIAPQTQTTGDRSTNLVIQYAPGTQVQVTVNQKPIDPTTPTQTQPDEANNRVRQVWYNLPLNQGENVITVQPTGGTPVSVTVTVKELATTLEILPKTDPRVPADGRSTVGLEGQILDDEGNPISRDAFVTLTATAGQFVGADQDRDRPGFQVLAQNGRFTAELRSTLSPQKVRIRAAVDLHERREVHPKPVPLAPIQVDPNGPSRVKVPAPELSPLELSRSTTQLEDYTQVEFITNLRPNWLISGTVNLRLGPGGTDFYGSFRDFLNPGRTDDDVRFDVNTAVFATGRIGEWLFTGAFNNTRPLNQICDGTTRLFRDPQFCDQVYPVYGDSSTTDFLTPSLDSVFIRLERTSPVPDAGSDFAMWGDYSTPELATASQLFTATNRQLHGFKGNFNLGNLQITGMYANNLQGFQRDAIAPNGTSGYYFLSRRLIIGGSEVVYLETEELQRPGTVLERKQLTRTLDYEIDYDRGSILFRRPVLQTDWDIFGRSIVRRIVVTYQYDSDGFGDTDLYAGRLRYHFSREPGLESWIGASYLNEDQGGRTFELYGVDAIFPLGKKGRLIAEYARSRNDSIFQGETTGNAYRLEAYGQLFESVLGRAYYRSVDSNFSNNATFSFFPGQTRYGAEIAAKIGQTTQVQFQYDRETNFGRSAGRPFDIFNPGVESRPGARVNNSLTTIRAGVTQKFGAADLSVDFVNRNRRDQATDNLDEDSSQLVTRLNIPITETLAFRALNETNLGSGDDPLYPNRTALGLDWSVMKGLTLRLAQQFFSGGSSQIRSNSITSLDTIVDHKIDENTIVTGRYSILNGVNGLTSQGAIGLNHRIILAPGLRLNLTYERIFGDIFAYTGTGQQFAQPYAVGQSSAAIGVTEGDSYGVALEYTDNPNFKASARFEYRDSEAGNSMVLSAAAAGKLSPAFTLLARYQQANFANQRLADRLGDTINIKLGLAYRNPFDDKFNALLRYEFRQNPSTIPNDIVFENGTGSNVHLLALEAIYAPNFRWEFYGKFALRSTRSYLARDLVGDNLITLSQFRVLYRLGYRWDLGGEVRWIYQPQTDYNEYGFALEAGYYLTPNLRLAAGYSFGKALDNDFDRSKGGPYVTLSLKLNELFGGFGVPMPAPPQQRESEVKPVATQQPGGTVPGPVTQSGTTNPTVQPAVLTQPSTQSTPSDQSSAAPVMTGGESQ
jgi:hypothetical protein